MNMTDIAFKLNRTAIWARTVQGLQMCGLLLLCACSSVPKVAQCSAKATDYLQAQDHAPLHIPDGIEAPDRRNTLKIPPENGQTPDPKRCLETAPAYFGTAARIPASPEEMVADWAQAWADRNSSIVMNMYASQFTPDISDERTAWLEQRRNDINTTPTPNPRVTNLKVTQAGDDQRIATFTQQFGATTVHKQLTLIREAGLWKIASERIIATP